MKKVIFAGLVAVLAVISAKAEYLYWQVTDTQYQAVGLTADTGYSRLFGYDGSSYTQLGNEEKGTARGSVQVAASALLSYTEYWVELASYDTSAGYVGKGKVGPVKSYSDFSISDLMQLNTVASMMSTWTSKTAQKGAVPEPTSGLMMLVGMALLGLKRRRA